MNNLKQLNTTEINRMLEFYITKNPGFMLPYNYVDNLNLTPKIINKLIADSPGATHEMTVSGEMHTSIFRGNEIIFGEDTDSNQALAIWISALKFVIRRDKLFPEDVREHYLK